ncbi:lasso RiPP family leader peptide-containing protein [Halioglobus maricola]|uniref:Lasso RiPP family leader peptide-containing protein n=1 Tax=Halioglobus maricola TaxID=2601894 RepID=A0A5P9NGA9_9GAMM|nr:lasso RiPP family leader peptide-containing protein [Halioglobus maricola]QFU74595.1 lasso RiPP family leader peptide-containing protein [Halioglobus maricola]
MSSHNCDKGAAVEVLKKRYRKPELNSFGKVRELTQGGTGSVVEMGQMMVIMRQMP